ncbi:MAG: response regulator, partial [Pseudomonadales bacterium]|nr:response regulator [Pseudomonadales bacterium]
LAEVNQTANRAATLIRQLLAFSRQQPLQAEVVDVAELISGFRSMLKRILREDIELNIELESGLWSVKADRGQLEQVLMNLTVNAEEAMPSGGTLNISAKNIAAVNGQPDLVQITVTDTGYGMSSETRDMVFEPFFTTRQESGGTGLGLAMVHGIVNQSGGTISLESEQGKGATFRIQLPRSMEDRSTARAESTVRSEGATEAVIMVVEDEASVRNLVTRLLSNEGYEVISIEDPTKVLHDSRLDRVNLLITDIVMPGMKGPELAERVREKCPGIAVLLMTGYARDESVALKYGEPILAKPFSPTDLSRRVRELLGDIL